MRGLWLFKIKKNCLATETGVQMRHFLPSKLYIINYLRKKTRKSCIFGLLYCQSKYCKVYGHNDISQKLGIQETCFDPPLIGNLFKHPQELFPLEIAKGLVTSKHHCPSTRPDEELVSCSPGSIGVVIAFPTRFILESCNTSPTWISRVMKVKLLQFTHTNEDIYHSYPCI